MFEAESKKSMGNGAESFLSVYLNVTIELLFLISINFQISAFDVLHTQESIWHLFQFQKKASKYNFAVNFKEWEGREMPVANARKTLVVFDRNHSHLQKLMIGEPKMIVALSTPNKISTFLANTSTDFMIPPTTTFFLVSIGRLNTLPHSTTGKLYALYKPSRNVKMKVFPMLSYDMSNAGNDFQWDGLTSSWQSYEREKFDLTDAIINIGFTVPEHYMNNTDSVRREYWRNTHTSFFWRELQSSLGFRPHFCFATFPVKKSEFYRSLFLKCAEAFSLLVVIASSRSNSIADFIFTGIDSRHLMLVAPPRYEHSWFSIFRPFEFESWIILAIFVLLMPLFLRIAASTSLDLSSAFLTITGFVCCQGSENTPRTVAPRLVCFVALFFSFSIYQFYTSNLYSLLSIREKKLPFNSLEEYVQLKPYPLYTLPQSPLYETVMSAESGPFKKLREEIWSKYPTAYFEGFNLNKLVEKACRGEATIFGIPFQMQYFDTFPCKLVQINKGYLPSSLGLLIKKGFAYKNQFTLMSLRFLEIGITHKYMNDYVNPDYKAPTKKMAYNKPIDMQQVILLFVIYILFIILSLFILCAEIFYVKIFWKPPKFRRKGFTSKRFVTVTPSVET